MKKFFKRALRVVKDVASVAVVVLPGGKILKIATAAMQVIPIINKWIKTRKTGGINMNPFETAIRKLVTTIIGLKKASGLEIAFALVPILLDSREIFAMVNDQPKEVWGPKLREALDNVVGSEENALVGSSDKALLKLGLPSYIPLEDLSDLIFKTIEKALLQGDN